MYVLFEILLSLTAIFLILLVLVQRGRGGGLTGALGGMGGQSAFGAKAGDVFTRVTIVTALIWVLLCVASIKFLGGRTSILSGELGTGTPASQGDNPSESAGGPQPPAQSSEVPGGPDSAP